MADAARIRAHLNLYALLQNLEELVCLDEQAAEIARSWRVSVQFTVRRGPAACLEFDQGTCTHRRGRGQAPAVSLLFTSPRHLNGMFDGRGMPIPLKGFTRLGWLSNEFGRLTSRLESYLKPEDPPADGICETLRATLLLQTAAYGASELAALEPTCRTIAARIPDGVIAVEVLPEGPEIHIAVAGGEFRVAKRPHEAPSAKLTFRTASIATAIMDNRLDPFAALATGDLALAGQIAMIEDFLLIMDRVESFLT